MTQNIEKVMERGERLEDLIAQTDDLEAHVSELKIFKVYECDREKLNLNNPQKESYFYCDVYWPLMASIMCVRSISRCVYISWIKWWWSNGIICILKKGTCTEMI